jgi:hypothetical protein
VRIRLLSIAGLALATSLSSLAAQEAPTGSILAAVLDSAGAPLRDARVALIPGDERGRTDDRGVFTFEAVRPGRYVLEAQHASYGLRRIEVIVTAGSQETVMMRLGQRTTMLDPVVVTLEHRLPGVHARRTAGIGAIRNAEELKHLAAFSADDMIQYEPAFRRIRGPSLCGQELVFVDGRRVPPRSWGRDPEGWKLSDFVRTRDIEVVEVHETVNQVRETFIAGHLGPHDIDIAVDLGIPLEELAPLASRTREGGGEGAAGVQAPQRAANPFAQAARKWAPSECQRVVLIWTRFFRPSQDVR